MLGFAVAVCILNVALWLVFLIKFKNLFSTDNIIEKTKAELNRIIMDVNGNAERNITLIEDRIERLRALIAEADKRIKLAESAEARAAAVPVLRSQVSGAVKKSAQSLSVRRAADAYKRNRKTPPVKPDDAFFLTSSGKSAAGTVAQNTLFDETGPQDSAGTEITVNGDGASYAEIPVISSGVIAPDPAAGRRDFREQVSDLYDGGLSVADIAARLSCSTTEVQFVLDLEGKGV